MNLRISDRGTTLTPVSSWEQTARAAYRQTAVKIMHWVGKQIAEPIGANLLTAATDDPSKSSTLELLVAIM
jgi:hypothetical protein